MPSNITKPIIIFILGFLLVLAAILVVMIFGIKTRTTKPEYIEIETKITQYIYNKRLNIRIHTPEYKTFLHDILLGEYPELTNNPSSKEILQYALDYLEIPRDKEKNLPLPPLNTSK